MPVIKVHLLTGRSREQKKAFIEQVATVAMRTLEVPERAVTIVLVEVGPESWGVGTQTISEMRSHGVGRPD